MDATMFDDLTRAVSERLTRRALGRVAGAGVLAAAVAPALGDEAQAKKHHKHKPRKKERTFCLNGQTIKTKQKRRKKRLRAQGATRGKCSSSCVPNCTGRCNVDDGCGGTCPGCATGSLCVAGTCHVCNVSCAQGDTPVQCGANLSTAMAAGGDIYLCAGRYDGPFIVTQDTALYGAGNGTDDAVDTILAGAGTALVMDIYTASKLTLSGLRLTDGYSGSYGGNMRIDNAAAIVTASNCVFSDGAGYRGGAIHMNDGLLNASKCQFLDNTSTSYGGALYVYNGTATITDTIFSGNEGNYGGGFYAYSASQISVSGSTFTLNTATTGGGGAISGYSGSVVTVTTSTFTSNQAMSGGAFYVDSGQTVTLDASVSITGNSAVDALGAGGGGVLVNSGTFNRGGATITNNSPDNCVGTGC